MPRYRKRPVIIEAFQLGQGPSLDFPPWACAAWDTKQLDWDITAREWIVKTLEDGSLGQAKHVGQPGDWLIRGVKGELYFCKPNIFAETYEPE